MIMEKMWNLTGNERRVDFEKQLVPAELKQELTQYQLYLGKEFTIQDLLHVYDIKSRALMAEGINDAPELLLDQIGQALSDSRFKGISYGLSDIATAIAEK